MAASLHSFIHYAHAKYMLWYCKYIKLRHSCWHLRMCYTSWQFMAVYSQHNRSAATTAHIQQYTLHWHNACCTSLPFMAVHSELTQQVWCTNWPHTAVHIALTQCLLHQLTIYGSTLWSVTIGLLHQVATYSSIHCSDTMPAAPAGNWWQYTLNWQQVCCTSWPLTTVQFALTQYDSGEKPCLVYRPLVSHPHYWSLTFKRRRAMCCGPLNYPRYERTVCVALRPFKSLRMFDNKRL
jgi:hypothetical protein